MRIRAKTTPQRAQPVTASAWSNAQEGQRWWDSWLTKPNMGAAGGSVQVQPKSPVAAVRTPGRGPWIRTEQFRARAGPYIARCVMLCFPRGLRPTGGVEAMIRGATDGLTYKLFRVSLSEGERVLRCGWPGIRTMVDERLSLETAGRAKHEC